MIFIDSAKFVIKRGRKRSRKRGKIIISLKSEYENWLDWIKSKGKADPFEIKRINKKKFVYYKRIIC